MTPDRASERLTDCFDGWSADPSASSGRRRRRRQSSFASWCLASGARECRSLAVCVRGRVSGRESGGEEGRELELEKLRKRKRRRRRRRRRRRWEGKRAPARPTERTQPAERPASDPYFIPKISFASQKAHSKGEATQENGVNFKWASGETASRFRYRRDRRVVSAQTHG